MQLGMERTPHAASHIHNCIITLGCQATSDALAKEYARWQQHAAVKDVSGLGGLGGGGDGKRVDGSRVGADDWRSTAAVSCAVGSERRVSVGCCTCRGFAVCGLHVPRVQRRRDVPNRRLRSWRR